MVNAKTLFDDYKTKKAALTSLRGQESTLKDQISAAQQEEIRAKVALAQLVAIGEVVILQNGDTYQVLIGNLDGGVDLKSASLIDLNAA